MSKTAARKHYFDLAMVALSQVGGGVRISSDEVFGAVSAINREHLRDAYAKGRLNCQRLIAASLMRRVMYMQSNDKDVLCRLHDALNDQSLVPRCTLTLGLNTDQELHSKRSGSMSRRTEVMWNLSGEISLDCCTSHLEDVLKLNDFLHENWTEQKVFSADLITKHSVSKWTITKVAQHESRPCCVAWMQFERFLIPFSDDDLTKLTEEVRHFLQNLRLLELDQVGQKAYHSFESGRFSPIDFIGAFGPDALAEIVFFISKMWFVDGSEWTVRDCRNDDKKGKYYFLLDSQCHDISLPSHFDEFISSSLGTEGETYLILYTNNLNSGDVQSIEIGETAEFRVFLRAAIYRFGEYIANAKENPPPSFSEPLHFSKVLEATSPAPLVRIEPSTVVDREAIAYHLKRISEMSLPTYGYIIEHTKLGRSRHFYIEGQILTADFSDDEDVIQLQDIPLTEFEIGCITSITVPSIHRRVLEMKNDGTVIGVVCRQLVEHRFHGYGLVASIADDGFCVICFRKWGETKSVRIRTSALGNHAVFYKYVPDDDPFETYDT